MATETTELTQSDGWPTRDGANGGRARRYAAAGFLDIPQPDLLARGDAGRDLPDAVRVACHGSAIVWPNGRARSPTTLPPPKT